MDRVADVARLVGGFTFTGTSRHFVQYRDAGRAVRVRPPDLSHDRRAARALPRALHGSFTSSKRAIEPKALLLRLMPQVDPATAEEAGLAVDRGRAGDRPRARALSRAISRRRGRSRSASGRPRARFDEEPVRRYVLRVPELPDRMRPLVRETPGITAFLPAGPGIAVQIGYATR